MLNSIMKKGVLFFVFAVLVASFVSAEIKLTGDVVSESSEMGVSSVLLKIVLTEGETLEKSFSVFSDETEDFFLEIIGVQGISLDESSFSLMAGDVKEVFVKFDTQGLDPGVYIGKIAINNGQEHTDLPISFEIESEDVFFDANLGIPPAYSIVSSGEKFVAQIKIFDLTGFQKSGSMGATSVNVDYFIKSKDGEMISWETESVVIDETAEFSKTLSLPDNIKEGIYFFGTIIRYGSSVATASQMFIIVEEERGVREFSFIGEDFELIIILVFILIIFAGFIFMFIYIIRDRDKMVLELKRYNSDELAVQRNLLFEQKRLLEDKGESKSSIKAEIKKKIGSLKRKQKKRVVEFRKLKKIGSVSEMEKKLYGWKKSGYNAKPLEYKMKGMSAKEMQRVMKKWKGQGYNK